MTKPQIPPQIVSLQDYIETAAEQVPAGHWAYLSGAGADGVTQADNRAAFRQYRLESRVLADLRGGHTRLHLFGADLQHPILAAPMAFQRLAHPTGEQGMALGVAAAGGLSVISCQASTHMDELAKGAQGPLWFQLYLQPDREDSLRLVRRAEAAGYRALVVTVDAPVNGMRNMEARAGFSLPPDVRAVNLDGCKPAAMSVPQGGSQVFDGFMRVAPLWPDIAWLRAQTDLPLLLKGILSPRDAIQALEHGADGIIVSNHGGRALDMLPATLDVLPGVVDALNGKIPVLLDGGIRRGTDVLMARALGAEAVLVGLPLMAALAVGGAAGVAHALMILRAELEVAMALTGCASLQGITPAALNRARGA
ncbi:4-hydroxymandelate oxidase [Poseidonocella pacifica]|uniref:4-hydroxymandelate oxidase n=1 Tax=Poseidonocella pacifica TaxID=871651 RepID=A0A1I0VVT8_9RHOB|nr:alpha-hydroxy acid oxidase [Poseidonocella pacifica]SFA80501.1 4-hydroxymandelate oxidase [Poseidonocella pacifica]